MKKLLVFFIIGFMFFGSCSAQNVNAQTSNDSQRIVGTWRGSDNDGDSYTFTFNSDGTYVRTGYGSGNGNYFISGSKLIFSSGRGATVTDYYFASNGSIIVFSVGTRIVWFNKQ